MVTAAFPTQQWPYIILMTLGIAVFCYIYYALTNYGSVIEAGTNATEDINSTDNALKDNNSTEPRS